MAGLIKGNQWFPYALNKPLFPGGGSGKWGRGTWVRWGEGWFIADEGQKQKQPCQWWPASEVSHSQGACMSTISDKYTGWYTIGAMLSATLPTSPETNMWLLKRIFVQISARNFPPELLVLAKVVTCKAFCQPIGVEMSTRHEVFLASNDNNQIRPY